MKKSERLKGEQVLALHIFTSGLPECEREYRWAAHQVGPGRGLRKRLAEAGLRDWRFDFAWPEAGMAVEVEGGTWSRGRHVRGKGYADDCVKYNWAQLYGWSVFRFTTEQVLQGEAIAFLETAWGRDLVEDRSP